MMDSLEIAPRFCGPPDVGNGGYVCGLVAARLAGPVEVTLHRPPPLATPMAIASDGGESVRVLVGETLIAQGMAAPAGVALEVPVPVSVDEARAAGERCPLRVHPEQHPFPGCFVCGPDRAPGDGLRIMVGRLDGRDLSADIWRPDEKLGDSAGHVRPEFVSAALDCAGGIGALWAARPDTPAYVLGRFTVEQVATVRVAEPHIVLGWQLADEQRKVTAGSALFTASGDAVAVARATWIRLR